jgi:hypothetical protein
VNGLSTRDCASLGLQRRFVQTDSGSPRPFVCPGVMASPWSGRLRASIALWSRSDSLGPWVCLVAVQLLAFSWATPTRITPSLLGKCDR